MLSLVTEEERRNFVRNTSLPLLDLARRTDHSTSIDVVNNVKQISRHLLCFGGVEDLTEEVNNSLVTVTALLCEVEQQHSGIADQMFLKQKGSCCFGRPGFQITAE